MSLTGKGYGTATTDAVLEYAFDMVGLHRVALQVFAFNTRAQRSYGKSGFVREGVWRKHLRWGQEWHDTLLMSTLDEEYAALRADRRRFDRDATVEACPSRISSSGCASVSATNYCPWWE